MTLEDIDAGECFISMMSAIIEPMTFELAQQEANADYRTEQQAERMGVNYGGL